MKKAVFACLLSSAIVFSSFAETPKPTTTAAPEATYNPVANPQAVVTQGNARFTVLTPQLIRMEWAADGKFEDHPSFVFLNRRLPVPHFTTKQDGHALTISTSDLELSYHPSAAADGKFTPDNLTITLHVD